MNQATHLLDGSMLYGTSQEKAKALRQMSGGKMKTQIDMDGHEYLPVFTPDKKMERCQISRNSSTCYESGILSCGLIVEMYRQSDRQKELNEYGAITWLIWIRIPILGEYGHCCYHL